MRALRRRPPAPGARDPVRRKNVHQFGVEYGRMISNG